MYIVICLVSVGSTVLDQGNPSSEIRYSRQLRVVEVGQSLGGPRRPSAAPILDTWGAWVHWASVVAQVCVCCALQQSHKWHLWLTASSGVTSKLTGTCSETTVRVLCDLSLGPQNTPEWSLGLEYTGVECNLNGSSHIFLSPRVCPASPPI